ncbi:MAG TPA: hypothetical protein VF115_07775 [Acidimicrobiia bacterium]
MAEPRHRPLIQDRERLGRVLFAFGVVGVVAAVVVGVAGWLLASRVSTRVTEGVEPLGDLVVNVSESVEATQVIVERTIEAVEGIESATRSAGRSLESLSGLIDGVGQVIGEDLAGSLESAVGTLPALVDTGRIIDGTMRTLSLVGVDYDPEAPLDESLASLEESLRPIPDQLRAQVEDLEGVGTDIDAIVLDAGSLAATLLEARIEMGQARDVLTRTSENVARATATIAAIEDDVSTYDVLSRIVVVAISLAALTAASAPLLVGLHYRQSGDAWSADTPTGDMTSA